MARIVRDPGKAASEQYDLIIIGGGIYGAMLALESSRRGLIPLLLERDDFGQHTSFNSLRIIHGGLRYLQSFDLHRFRESVNERKWFLKTFPHLVKPLPCLMPLYGNGLRRPFVFRLALWLNDLFSYTRNHGVYNNHCLPSGRIVDSHETRAIFPSVDSRGLKGGAIWYDALLVDSQRFLINLLRLGCEFGATAINYLEVCRLLKKRNRVIGVEAIDKNTGNIHEYKANIVINACGPWSRDIAKSFDRDEPSLFKASLVWNVLLDKQPLSDHALAVEPKKRDARTYFLLPWKGKTLAGTGHSSWPKDLVKQVRPSAEQLFEFLNDLNSAVPGLDLNLESVIRIMPGLLPVTESGGVTLTVREVILNHASHGGPVGLWSVSGVKYTTARLVAEKTLNRIFPDSKCLKNLEYETLKMPKDVSCKHGNFYFNCCLEAHDTQWKNFLRSSIVEESVQHLDDLVLRRTNLWEDPHKAIESAPIICDLFNWDESYRKKEITRLTESL
jgi:glycerol-3-phosphate dehydrogenase